MTATRPAGQISGAQLIAGNAVAAGETFNCAGRVFHEATRREIESAVVAAAEATSPLRAAAADGTVAVFLRALADRLEEAESVLVATAAAESNGSPERLAAELGRATTALRFFAERSAVGYFTEATISQDRDLDLRRMNMPVGVVGVFEAGNMPFFLGVAGADTTSAWAAGCPVIVKAHPDHAATSELVAHEVIAAAEDSGFPPGLFSHLNGRSHAVGTDLVAADGVHAISFTGSANAARALAQRIAERVTPVPFYGELGSSNPVFVTATALQTKSDMVGSTLAAAVQTNRGQVCTKPTFVFVPDQPREAVDDFVATLSKHLSEASPGRLLSEPVDQIFTSAVESLAATEGVSIAAGTSRPAADGWRPAVFDLDYQTFQAQPDPWHELFGPAICVIRATDTEMLATAEAMPGQLTTTLFTAEADDSQSEALVDVASARAGRVVINAAPTGVAVVDAMHHGGPWPAATHPGFTSVGPRSVRRFQRPVAFQNAPQTLLPPPLRDPLPTEATQTA